MKTWNKSQEYKHLHPALTLLDLERASPERREDTIGPVVGGDVETPEHLRRRDGLGIHPQLAMRLAARRHGAQQRGDALRLAGARRPQRHHAVTHQVRLVQLNIHTHAHTLVDKEGRMRDHNLALYS